MRRGLAIIASTVIALSALSALPGIVVKASANVCAPSTGTVSGNTRFAIFNSGTGCSWTVPAGVTSIQYLVVGGGGGGGGAREAARSPNLGAGGGGAGGIVQASSFSTSGGASLTITVGAGGALGAASTNGSNGEASSLTFSTTTITSNGGSGGGGSIGAHEQANLSGDGGGNSSFSGGANDWDGAGGGAGSAGNGVNGTDIAGQGGNGGAGGVGTLNTLLGSNNYYGGGGGGGGTPSTNSSETNGNGGAGGSSVGGSGGGRNGIQPTAGAANTGSGGGGGGWRSTSADTLRAGANGAAGTVILVFTKSAGAINSLSITSNSGSDNTYKTADTIDVRLVMSEAITVSGSPRIAVLGLTSKFFTYLSGSGTTSLVFRYTVTAGDSATAGVGVTANTLALNSGTLNDSVGVPVSLSHSAIAVSTSHRVDGIAPTITAISSISIPENSSTVQTFTASEAGTFGFAGTGDKAFFTLDTQTGFLTISPRDFESPTDADLNNIYYIAVNFRDLAGNMSGNYNINVTITNVAESATLGAPTLAATATKGIFVNLTVTTDAVGRFTYFANGKKITGCIRIPTTGTAPSISGLCRWRPATTAPVRLHAVLAPTNSSISTTTTSSISVRPVKRTTQR